MEENLNSTMNSLNEERNKYARFQQVLESEKGLKQKVWAKFNLKAGFRVIFDLYLCIFYNNSSLFYDVTLT